MPDDEKPDTNKGVIFVVICTLSACAVIGVGTLAYCLGNEKKLDPTQLTAFVGMTTASLGVLGGILSKTSPTEATKAAPPPPSPPPPPPPQQVTVNNPPDKPIPTQEVA